MREKHLVAVVAALLVGLASAVDAGEAQGPTTDVATSTAADRSTLDDPTPFVSTVTPEGVPVDIHRPAGDGPWPVLVLLHGAPPATKEDVSAMADWIAGAGTIVYNVGWTEGGFEGVRGSVVNVACAVAYARDTTARDGGYASRITLVGLSAGGWSGAAVALGGDVLGAECDSGSSSLPEAFVGIAGAYSAAVDGPPASMLADDPEVLRSIDPYTYLGENPSLEVWLVHGDADRVVPLPVAEEFRETLVSVGYRVELLVLEDVGHPGGGLDADDQEAILATIVAAAHG